ncbi:hypothetical protein GIB67_013895 [Kingdonia uniflora]|uniref:Uncharacterized protein n=1 Tax=Kingdonia uniflora TaxID=39325 RepID=A0A7J7LDI2_9MAGN|nr:hypothetical protein GIB67_013895 [Kingdonia uniflora]
MQIIHGGQTCGSHFLSFLIRAYGRALPVYLPVYLIPALIVHRQELSKRPYTILGKGIVGTARSSLFLSVYCSSAWMWTCALFRVFKRCNIPMVAMGMIVGNNKKKTASKQPTQGDRLRDLEDKVKNFMVATEKSLGEFSAQSKRTNQTLNSILRAITSSATNGQRGFGTGVTESVTSSKGREILVEGFMRDARVVGYFTTSTRSIGRGRGSADLTSLENQFNEERAVFTSNSFVELDVKDTGSDDKFGDSGKRDHVPIREKNPLLLREVRPESSTRRALRPNPKLGEGYGQHDNSDNQIANAIISAFQNMNPDVKISVPKFDGKTDTDGFINWLNRVDRVLAFKKYGDSRAVTLMETKHTGYAMNWWECVQQLRVAPGGDYITD